MQHFQSKFAKYGSWVHGGNRKYQHPHACAAPTSRRQVTVHRTQSGENITFAPISALTTSGLGNENSACANSDKARSGLPDNAGIKLLLADFGSNQRVSHMPAKMYTAYL